MSLTVIRPRSSNSSFTTSTRSSFSRCISALPSSSEAPSRTVTRRSRGVMMVLTGASSRVSKRRSRLVTMPTTTLPCRTGNPEIPRAFDNSMTWRTVISGVTVTGSRSTPDSYRLTLATSAACCFGVRFLCTKPMPPSWASAIARRASVTVSIAAETSGRLRRMLREREVARLVSRGRTLDRAGTSNTSSKVSALPRRRIESSRRKSEL
jgi:hypothetical protein